MVADSVPQTNAETNGRANNGQWLPGHTPPGAKPFTRDAPRPGPGRPPVARALRKALRGGGMERVVAGVVEAAAGGDANAFGKIRDTIDGPPVARVAALAVVASPSSDEQLAASVRALISAFGSTGTDAVD